MQYNTCRATRDIFLVINNKLTRFDIFSKFIFEKQYKFQIFRIHFSLFIKKFLIEIIQKSHETMKKLKNLI